MNRIFIALLVVALLTGLHTNAQMDTAKLKEMNVVLREENFDKKVELFNAYKQKWPDQAGVENERMVNRMYNVMARAAMRADRTKAFDEYSAHATSPDAMLNFEFAQKLVKENKYPEDAKKYAAVAYNAAKQEADHIIKPANQPDSIYQQLLARKNFVLAKYADVYAQASYQTGDFATGLPVAKEAAVELSKSMDWGYNEHYALLLAKAAPVADAKSELERLMRLGMLNDNGQTALKEVYVLQNKTDKGYDVYLQKLKSVADDKARASLKPLMLSTQAPRFVFSKLYKGDVSLAQLKGKVVVLDFWATWCIPCVASFPAMQKVVDKYKNDPNVVFLFVDTKEQMTDVEAARTKVQKFLTKEQFEKLTFNFVLDDGEKNANAYGVKMIPAKYIIDANGIIRFNTTGFSGKDDDLVNELSLMIEMAKEQKTK